MKKRFGNNFTLFGNYTYSKAYDTSTDFNTDYGPQDPTDLNADRALSRNSTSAISSWSPAFSRAL